LRFSRQNEQEADNIGMQTLVASGFNANDMTAMFENMLDANRFQGKRPPEYLLSHPVTERRVADSRSRARALPAPTLSDNPHYHLMRARVQLHHSDTPQVAVKRFQGEVEGNTLHPEASRYGLALAFIKTRQFKEARSLLQELIRQRPEEQSFALALASLELEQDNAPAAITVLLQQPQASFPAQMLLGKAWAQLQEYKKAEQIFYQLSQQRPGDVTVWYELAEVRGLSGNIAGLHMARAEYYVLNGVYDLARTQLEYAQKLLKDNYVETERIKQKLLEIDALEKISLDI
jgi:predicted Zn-dependent protease